MGSAAVAACTGTATSWTRRRTPAVARSPAASRSEPATYGGRSSFPRAYVPAVRCPRALAVGALLPRCGAWEGGRRAAAGVAEGCTSAAAHRKASGVHVNPYYADDMVTLYLGDCLEVMAGLPDASVDAVVTDPPYSSGGRRENARSLRRSMTRAVEDDDWIRGDSMSTAGFVWLLRACGVQWRRVLTPGGHVLAFIDWRMAGNLAAALESADLRQHPTLVWDKTHFGMGAIFRNQYELIVHMSAGTPRPPARRDVGNVLRFPAVRDGDHPTEKPQPLLGALLSVVCPSGAVLDPFAGVGTALTAARMRGLRAVGIEADERYCEIAARRLAQDVLPLPALT